MRDLKGTRVFVGLSGGVDSAVSAALLRAAGAEVTGVFIKGWYPPGMPCTWAADRRDAMRVAARLQIPFLTLDASREYKRGVIEYLLSEYKAGRTPNPDVMCNRDVKFGAFHRFAKAQGADFIATGHYAQSEEGKILRGVEPAKDQSYFLWAIPKAAIADTVFPVGGMPKSEVRKLAQKFALPVAGKKDSQGICFLGSISVEDFLKHEFGEAPGTIVDDSGVEVGRHNGVFLHTLGERLSISGGPWFVVGKDIEKNRLIATRTPETIATSKEVHFSDANWFSDPTKATSMQYRYHGPIISGRIEGEMFVADTALPEVLAAGQSAVFYRESELIGGGIIRA